MNTPATTEQQWDGNRRQDGLTVVEGIDGWIVMPTEGGPAMGSCPCCGRPMKNDRAARLVADLVYPVGRRER